MSAASPFLTELACSRQGEYVRLVLKYFSTSKASTLVLACRHTAVNAVERFLVEELVQD